MDGAEPAFVGFSRHDMGAAERAHGLHKLHELSKADSDEIDRMLQKDKRVQPVYDRFHQLRRADGGCVCVCVRGALTPCTQVHQGVH